MGWFKRKKEQKELNKIEKSDFESFIGGINTIKNNLATKTAECQAKDVEIRRLTNENQKLRNELQEIKNILKGVIN